MQRAGQVMRHAIYNIYHYRFDYIQVFALIRLCQFLFFLPVSTIVFKLMLRVTGYTHITEQNIQRFISHPFVILMLCLVIMVFLLFIYYEMGFLFFNGLLPTKRHSIPISNHVAAIKSKGFFSFF